METIPVFTCPECGEKLVILVNSTRVTCPACGTARLLFLAAAAVPAAGEVNAPAIPIHTLAAEMVEMEKQLEALSERWGLIDLVRNIGLILIVAGVGYIILTSLTSLSMLTFGAYGMLTGILLHGCSQLFGKGYYIQKAFLQELILLKQKEIEQQKSWLLKSGNITF